jgi:hypothetical protein
MKKSLMLLFVIALATTSFAGKGVSPQTRAKLDDGIEKSGTTKLSKVADRVAIGQMSNAYAIISGPTNMIAYDPISNTTVVIKRRGPAGTDGSVRAGSGTIAHHISKDGGATWSAAQETNGHAPASARYPSVALVNNGGAPYVAAVWPHTLPNWGTIGSSSFAAEAVESQKPTALATYYQNYMILGVGDTAGINIPNELYADEKNGVLYFSANYLKITNGLNTNTYKNYTMPILRSTDKGATWSIFHEVKEARQGGNYFDATSAAHGDFNKDGKGWFVTAVSPKDSAYAAQNNLNELSYYPHLVQMSDGAVVSEGLINIYELPEIKALGLNSWPGEATQSSDYDIVTDKAGNFHFFLTLQKEIDTVTVENLGIYEIYSKTPGLSDLGVKKVADARANYFDLSIDGTDAYNNLEAATDLNGEYVFTKWLDVDEFDETTTELYFSGRAISSSEFTAPLAVGGNDFEMQFQSKLANRVGAATSATEGKVAFQGNIVWAAFGYTGADADGTLPVTLNYEGPVLELDPYTGGAATAKLTFIVNTAFVQDTLSANHTVSFRGTAFGGDWSYDKGVKFTNIGGDYWKAEKEWPIGNTGGIFKIVTSSPSGTGWDRHEYGVQPVTGDDTFMFYTTGLTNVYTDPVTGAEITRGDDWDPLAIAKEGTTGKVAVHFRVNMQPRESFNPAQHEVQVRGGFNDWGGGTKLYPEVRYDDMDATTRYDAPKYFFSRTVLIDAASIGSELKYKFTYTDPATQWESISDRPFTLKGDTTLAWKTWDNLPIPKGITGDGKIVINYSVDLAKAINTNGFDKSKDTLYVKAGLGNTAAAVIETKLAAPLLGNVFSGKSDSVDVKDKAQLFYGYFKRNDKGEFEEFYFDNFDSSGKANGPKFRKILVNGVGISYDANDKIKDGVSTHRQPFFKNTNAVGAEVTFTLEANIQPARFFTKVLGGSLADIQNGPVVVTAANIDDYALYVNGPATSSAGNWAPWNDIDMGDTRKLNDSGINGDAVAGDRVWTVQFTYPATAGISQEFKLGIKGADNEAGFGNNHMYNLIAGGTNTFRVQFGDIQPSRFKLDANNYWDFAAEAGEGWGVVNGQRWVSVNDGSVKAEKFALLQNYPNPFNPATSIPFTVVADSKVNFSVYNTLGQTVSSFVVNAKAGYNVVPFSAENLASGTYLVKMTSGSNTKTIKMVFMK